MRKSSCCHRCPQAEQLIRARLAATPDEPRLWCALGDLNLDDDAYRKAWDCSVRCASRLQLHVFDQGSPLLVGLRQQLG